MIASIGIRYRKERIYLQHRLIPLDPLNIYNYLLSAPGEPILQSAPEPLELGSAIEQGLQLPYEISIEDFLQRKKSKKQPLFKAVGERSYRQLERGMGVCYVDLIIDEFLIIPMYPDRKPGSGFSGKLRSQVNLRLSGGYISVAEIVLKHLLDPANRYPED